MRKVAIISTIAFIVQAASHNHNKPQPQPQTVMDVFDSMKNVYGMDNNQQVEDMKIAFLSVFRNQGESASSVE